MVCVIINGNNMGRTIYGAYFKEPRKPIYSAFMEDISNGQLEKIWINRPQAMGILFFVPPVMAKYQQSIYSRNLNDNDANCAVPCGTGDCNNHSPWLPPVTTAFAGFQWYWMLKGSCESVAFICRYKIDRLLLLDWLQLGPFTVLDRMCQYVRSGAMASMSGTIKAGVMY